MPDHPFAFDEAGARFQQLDALLLAGDTMEYEWTRGRAYVSRLQERIADIPGVELYPDWYWHVTVKGAGFQVIKRTHDDDVLRQDVPRVAAQGGAAMMR